MARPRSYRHDVRCPHCQANWIVKNGKDNGKQTYLCRECNHRFTPEATRHFYSAAVKQQAMALYCEGTGVRAIGRVLAVKTGTLYSWIKKRAQRAMEVVERCVAAYDPYQPSPPSVKAISLDEMWTYKNARKQPKREDVWVWTAVAEREDGSRCVFFEVGDRSEATFLRLVERLPLAETYHTDGYAVYGWFPRHQHIRGKFGKGNRNEGVHSILRDRLYRLARRTKGYTKSLEMLRGSIALVCLQLGWI